MSAQESPDVRQKFTRKSETESICMCCDETVRTDRYTPLQEAERIHFQRLPAKGRFGHAVRLALVIP
jgi:hypothetical protein